MRHYQIKIGSDRSLVELQADVTGRGINIILTGGESPHIGGVAVCAPDLNQAEISLTIHNWEVSLPGHKDIHVAKPLAEMICRLTGQVTVVTAGIHIEQAQIHEINLLQQNCSLAGQKFWELLQAECE